MPAFHTALGRWGRFHKRKGSCWGEELEELWGESPELDCRERESERAGGRERDEPADKNLSRSSGS